ncbi:MAG: double zinc ribbon domain-containing protein, partial [Candidatus Rokuibacteriota bacterium]
MRCARCSHDNDPTLKLCGGCGARLGPPCAGCGVPTAPADRFCSACGAPLRAGAVPARPAPPTYLARKIRTARGTLNGERKQVTVLFADLKDSLALLADRDPEDARALLDAVLTLMMEAVHRFEGTVNQAMGDGIMAL